MSRAVQVQGLIAAAVIGVSAFIAWRAWRAGKGLAQTAAEVAQQAAADVTSAVENNIIGPFQAGQAWAKGQAPAPTVKQLLYSDAAYAGTDQVGAPIVAGDWWDNRDALRYEYERREAGAPPAIVSGNGAAFGIYPSAGRRRVPPPAPPGAPVTSP